MFGDTFNNFEGISDNISSFQSAHSIVDYFAMRHTVCEERT